MKRSLLMLLTWLLSSPGWGEEPPLYRSATATVTDHSGYNAANVDHAVMMECSWSLAPDRNPMVLVGDRLRAVSAALEGAALDGHGMVSHVSKGAGFGTEPMSGTKEGSDARVDELLSRSFAYPPPFLLRKQIDRPVTMKSVGPNHHAEDGPGTIVGYTYSYDLLAGGRPVFNGRVTINVSAQGVRSIAYAPVAIGAAKPESVPAMDPALAFRNAGAQLDARGMIAGTCTINAVALGYLLLDGPSGRDSAILLPAWRFDVEREAPPHAKQVRQIFLHAVDGRVLDATGQR